MPTTKAFIRRGGFSDLLTGDSSDFDGSIGNWAAIAGGGAALSYDGAVGIDGKGSVKIHQTGTSGPGGQVTLPGVYETGKTYQVIVALWMETFVAAEYIIATVEFGDFGASDTSGDTNNEQVFFNQESNGMPFDAWVHNVVDWTPTADRTDPVLQVRIGASVPSKTVDYDYHVGLLRVIEVKENEAGFEARPVGRAGFYRELVMLALGHNQGQTGFGLPHQGSTGMGARVLFSQGGIVLQGPPNANGDTSEVDCYTYGVYATGTQLNVGRRGAYSNSDGWDEEIGPDYVGWIRGERSASEVEFQPDGPYDIILVDGEDDSDLTHRWQFETADAAAAANAMPSMGRLPQYAAAPHVGTEEEGESYYDTVLHKSRTWDGTVWQSHW